MVAPTENNLFAKRALAYLIDIIVVGVLCFVVEFVCLYAFGKITGVKLSEFLSTRQEAFQSFTRFTNVVGFFSYFSLFYWYTNGQTFGKKLFELRVVSNVDTNMSFGRAFFRSAAYQLSYLTLSIGFLLPLFRRDGKTLHDLVSGTRVVEEKNSAAAADENSQGEKLAA